MEYDFGKKILDLLKEQKKSKKSLYERLEMSAQGLDAMLKNNSISAVRMAEIANFFGVGVEYFYGGAYVKPQRGSSDGGAFGEEVLNALRGYFEEEIKAKNRQIDGMQRTIDTMAMLLGKHKGDIVRPLWPNGPALPEKMETFFGEIVEPMEVTA